MIEVEICYVRTKIEHPELIPVPKQAVMRFPYRWKGNLSELMELLCALWFNGNIIDQSGCVPSFTSYIKNCERLFNVRLATPFKKRAQLADRKDYATPLLDALKQAYKKNIEKIGIKKQ